MTKRKLSFLRIFLALLLMPLSASMAAPIPSDTNVDFKIDINEATFYGFCWKSAPTVPTGCPANASLDYAVRGGTLYNASADGSYHYDSTQTCPLCWQPGPNQAAAQCMWSNKFGGTTSQDSAVPLAIKEDRNGNVFIAGYF